MFKRRTRLWLISSFSLLLMFGFALTRGDAQPNSVKKIVDGVWFREGDLKNMVDCNNIIIEMKDYLIVVDANFTGGARAALEDTKKISKKPVRLVFDTHHHGDHAYGNAVWTKQGAVTLAYIGVAEEMKRALRGKAGKADAPEPPKETFAKSPHVVKDDFRTVEFRFLGWAHTRGDGFVYLPKEKVLCTGDAAVNGPYNFTADGNIGNWPKVMDEALKLDAVHILPGHGQPGGREILEGQRDFMIELRKAVKAAALTSSHVMPADVKLPARLTRWVGDAFPGQVQDALNEIKLGKPAGDIPHK